MPRFVSTFTKTGLLACLALLLPALPLAAGNYAFPQAPSLSYTQGFRPALAFGANWAADYGNLSNKWTLWKAARITGSGAGGNLRVQRDAAQSNDTVSEGISYGMLLAVYFDDQPTFNGLWLYKQSKNDSLGLMNWKIDNAGNVTSDGHNSAVDADEDIAYSLYLAHYQWGSGGTYNYKALADAEVAKLKNYDLDGSLRVKPGDSFNSCRYPSYFFPNEYRIFGKQTGDTYTWDLVRNNCYATIAAARNGATGLVADQCTDTGQGGGCAGATSTDYYYNSCRVPFRMALDYCYYNDPNAKTEMNLLGGFFGPIWPSSVGDRYTLSGSQTSSNNNSAFEGPAACAFMVGGGANLQNYYNTLMGYSDTTYYSGAIQLLTLLLLQGNMPNIADPSAIYTPTPTPTRTPYAGTPTSTATQTPIAFGYIFEDFETGSIKAGYPWSTGTASISQNISTAFANSGTDSNKIVVSVPSVPAGNYAGIGFSSNYANGLGVVDATGANAIRLAFKGDPTNTVKFVLQIKEAGALGAKVAGGDGEVWDSPTITIPAGSGWTTQVLPLPTGWTRDLYSGTQAGGDLTLNLSAIMTLQFNFNNVPTTGTIYVDDIAFVPAVAPTPTSTKTPFNNPYAQLYDDIEAPMSLSLPARAGTYADAVNGASATWSKDTLNYVAGNQSAKLTYNTGSAASYGCGGFDISPYGTPALYVDASGAAILAYWLYSPSGGLKYQMEFQEAGSPTSHTAGTADGEAWLSSIQTSVAGWQYVQLDIGNFTEDPYNPVCNPSPQAPAPGPCITGANKGDNAMDLQAISSVSIKLMGNQGSGTLNLDDISFITTWKTSTPTISPSPTVSPTRTPSNSPSPTPTPTASPTQTISPSPSNTVSPTPSITATHTPMGTDTATPTETIYAGTPTFTVTISPTPSNTPAATDTVTLTLTSTPVPTWTSTLTGTPLPGTPTFTMTPAPPTLTSTYTSTLTLTQTPLPATSTFTPNITATYTVTNVVAPPTLTSTPTPSRTLTSTPAPTAMINDFGISWSPKDLTVTVGTTVTWAWIGFHDVMSDSAIEVYNSGGPMNNGTLSHTFSTVGIYGYYCTLHGSSGGGGMYGRIHVVAAPTPTVAVSSGGPPIIETRPFPNPNPGSVRVHLNAAVESLEVKVYTPAMMVVGLAKTGACAPGWATVSLPAALLGGSDGIYYYVVTAQRNGNLSQDNGRGRLMVVR